MIFKINRTKLKKSLKQVLIAQTLASSHYNYKGRKANDGTLEEFQEYVDHIKSKEFNGDNALKDVRDLGSDIKGLIKGFLAHKDNCEQDARDYGFILNRYYAFKDTDEYDFVKTREVVNNNALGAINNLLNEISDLINA
jgi:hypothetical protein